MKPAAAPGVTFEADSSYQADYTAKKGEPLQPMKMAAAPGVAFEGEGLYHTDNTETKGEPIGPVKMAAAPVAAGLQVRAPTTLTAL